MSPSAGVVSRPGSIPAGRWRNRGVRHLTWRERSGCATWDSPAYAGRALAEFALPGRDFPFSGRPRPFASTRLPHREIAALPHAECQGLPAILPPVPDRIPVATGKPSNLERCDGLVPVQSRPQSISALSRAGKPGPYTSSRAQGRGGWLLSSGQWPPPVGRAPHSSIPPHRPRQPALPPEDLPDSPRRGN